MARHGYPLALSEWTDGSSVWWLNKTTRLSWTKWQPWSFLYNSCCHFSLDWKGVGGYSFVTSCSIRPFVKTFPCIWGWLFRLNLTGLLRARTLIKKHKQKFKSATWSSCSTVVFAWCVRADGWPPLSRERFWPPKPYREGSMTGEELFMLGWSPILAAIWKCNRQSQSLPTCDSWCRPVQTRFLYPQMIQINTSA